MEAEGAPLPGEDELFDRPAQGLGLLEGGLVIDFAQQHGELVTTDAGQLGMARQLVRELGCQLPEQLVTGGMATQVVDLLEAVQAQVQQMAEAALGGTAQGFREQPFQLATVEQAGQCVMCSQLLQALLERAAFAEVDHYAFDAVSLRAQMQRQVDPEWALFQVVQLAFAGDRSGLGVELLLQLAPLGFAEQSL